MQLTSEALSAAAASLETALEEGAEHGLRVWAARVDQALSVVEQAIWRRDGAFESPEGGTSLEGGRAPSPGTDRDLDRLHDERNDLLAEAGALRWRLRRLLEDNTDDKAQPEAICRRAAALLGALERYERDETWLVLEVATTDIGAGD
jgi:hypothetical protein